MKKTVMKRWVKALRSGKYKQSKRKLKRTSKGKDLYCCLGVLCDISKQGEWENNKYKTSDSLERDVLPPAIMDWAGITEPNGNFSADIVIDKFLTDYNDDGCTFEQIANIIEKNWKQL